MAEIQHSSREHTPGALFDQYLFNMKSFKDDVLNKLETQSAIIERQAQRIHQLSKTMEQASPT